LKSPSKADRLVLVADRALETSRLKREVKQLKTVGAVAVDAGRQSASISQLRQAIDRVAPTNSRVLCCRPSGAGKETGGAHAAPSVGACQRPFMVINAARITPDRMEIELFGVDQTNGSDTRKAARWKKRMAERCSIDDIADLPRETQNKILRVLVDQTFQRVRRSNKIALTCVSCRRPRAISKQRLPKHIPRGSLSPAVGGADPRAGAGRAPRGYPALVEYFMARFRTPPAAEARIGDDAMAVLQSHSWPGNVRQLRNNVERLMILAGGDPDAVLDASMLRPTSARCPDHAGGNGGEQLMGLPLRDAREVFEREYLVAQISRFGGNISRTAEFVGMEALGAASASSTKRSE